MGCINSSNKVSDLKFENGGTKNVYRVRVIRLLNDSSLIRSGFLELTPKELIFTTQGINAIVWPLQHLRRYGVNGDIFSFEAGRRCMSGPGIYMFRCQKADSLYRLFQMHVNAVPNMSDHLPQSASNLTRSNELSRYTVNNLQTVPLSGSLMQNPMHVDLPSSVPNLSYRNELVPFQNQSLSTYQNSNLYQEYPMKYNEDKGRESSHAPPFVNMAMDTEDVGQPTVDAMVAESAHTYNDEINGDSSPQATYTICSDHGNANAERCYENLDVVDVPHLLQNIKGGGGGGAYHKTTKSGMNYIVLDLDNCTSPASLKSEERKECCPSLENVLLSPAACRCNHNAPLAEKCRCCEDKGEATPDDRNSMAWSDVNGSSSYSTIDFIKTCALLKSKTCATDLDQEGIRITRHSNCARHAYSISE